MNQIELVRAVAAAHQELLNRNTNASCFQFITKVIEALHAAGDTSWGYVGKTGGEAQYAPPTGFPRQMGPYTLTGVSHDAIANPQYRVDLLGRGNDSPVPLGVPALPQWLEIPPEHWRANNPIVPIGFANTSAPPPAAPAQKPYPGDAFFIEKLGADLAADYAEAKQAMNAGSVVWISRTLWRYLNEGMTIEQSTAQSRKEWRAALGL